MGGCTLGSCAGTGLVGCLPPCLPSPPWQGHGHPRAVRALAWGSCWWFSCRLAWGRDSRCLWPPVSAPPSLLPLLGLGWGSCGGGKLGKKCQGRQGHDSSMPSNAAVKQWALGNSACQIVAWDCLGAPLCCSCTKPVIWQKSAQLAGIVHKEPGAEWAQG